MKLIFGYLIVFLFLVASPITAENNVLSTCSNRLFNWMTAEPPKSMDAVSELRGNDIVFERCIELPKHILAENIVDSSRVSIFYKYNQGSKEYFNFIKITKISNLKVEMEGSLIIVVKEEFFDDKYDGTINDYNINYINKIAKIVNGKKIYLGMQMPQMGEIPKLDDDNVKQGFKDEIIFWINVMNNDYI